MRLCHGIAPPITGLCWLKYMCSTITNHQVLDTDVVSGLGLTFCYNQALQKLDKGEHPCDRGSHFLSLGGRYKVSVQALFSLRTVPSPATEPSVPSPSQGHFAGTKAALPLARAPWPQPWLLRAAQRFWPSALQSLPTNTKTSVVALIRLTAVRFRRAPLEQRMSIYELEVFKCVP